MRSEQNQNGLLRYYIDVIELAAQTPGYFEIAQALEDHREEQLQRSGESKNSATAELISQESYQIDLEYAQLLTAHQFLLENELPQMHNHSGEPYEAHHFEQSLSQRTQS